MDEFTRYYLHQVGRGNEASPTFDQLGPVYRGGFSRGQQGRGIFSNALKGLWNWVSPLFTSGAQAVGRQALDTGAKILTDAVAGGGDDQNLSNIAKQRLTEGRDQLINKMKGSGRGRKRERVMPVKKRRRTKRPRTKGDIFESI